MANEWVHPQHAETYLARMHSIPHRAAGEATLLSEVPTDCRRILDLGCGDGHLLALVLTRCPQATGVGLDFSPTMLERASQRFDSNPRVQLVNHDLEQPLPEFEPFDCVVSSFAIHHCGDERKRSLYAEILRLLEPDGLFCNLEHVSSPTPEFHQRFLEELGLTPDDEDPSNILLDVQTQLNWLTEIGYQQIDCLWKWRELALLTGRCAD